MSQSAGGRCWSERKKFKREGILCHYGAKVPLTFFMKNEIFYTRNNFVFETFEFDFVMAQKFRKGVILG